MSRSHLLPVALVSTVLLSLALPAAAQETAAGSVLQPLDLPDGVNADLRSYLMDPERVVTVMVDLEEPPVAVAEAAAQEAGGGLSEQEQAAMRAELRAEQADLAEDIEALGGTVLAGLQDAYNGIRVQTSANRIDDIAALPDAVAVRRLDEFELHSVDSTRVIGAPQVWGEYGLTGESVSIAVIDTGVDYLHADFDGVATDRAYELNDPDVVEPGSFPTAKVVGGYDFVGNDYNASSNNPDLSTPDPDGDPLDCNGHGTHVAGTAAGVGVTDEGQPYDGAYTGDLFTELDFLVGPGVAPEAELYALKVFGCGGTTNVVVDAINWAVANDVDVINMSLGASFGRPSDPSSIAATNAALAGVVVVTSAGNAGDQPYVAGSPAAGEGTISVAAVDGRATLAAATLVADTDTLTLQNSNDAELQEPVTGEVVVLRDDPSTPVNEALGCDADDYADVPDGAIVVAFRGACALSARAVLGQEAGASAVVLVSNAPGYPPSVGEIDDVTIPLLGARQEDAGRLRALDGQSVTIEDAEPLANPGFRAPASFTSSGPSVGTSAAKPDVAAPGVAIQSAAVGTGTGRTTMSGTSMAAPHVAGLAALTIEAHPDWAVDALKASIVNTADPDAVNGYEARLVGAGLVQAVPAVATTAVAVGDPLTSSLSFGFVEGAEPTTLTKTVEVWNDGDQTVVFEADARITNNAGDAGAVWVTPAQFSVAPQSGRNVTVTLHLDLPAVPPSFDTVAGLVAFRPLSDGLGVVDALRVPFLAVPKGVSDLSTAPDPVLLESDVDSVFFTTRNAGPVPGPYGVYAWGLADAAGESVIADIRAAGVQALPDVDPVGGATGLGEFAITTNTVATTFSGSQFEVLVDTDEDDTADYVVFGVDQSRIGGPAGVFASVIVEQPSNDIVAAYATPTDRNDTTLRLPFALSDILLSPDNPDFTYTAAVFLGDPDDVEADFDEVEGWASFDAYEQPVGTGQRGVVAPGERDTWTAVVNRDELEQHPQLGWMVVYPQNRSGQPSAQLILLRTLES